MGRMLMPDMRGLRVGDADEWEKAFPLIWPVACSAVRRRLATAAPADVEDVAMNAITEVVKMVKAGKIDTGEELKALTAVIAARRALDHIRRTQAAIRSAHATAPIEEHEDRPSAAPRPLEEAPGPLEKVEAQELSRLLVDLGASIPEHQWKLLKAYYGGGKTQAELAKDFGMPLGTVGVTLSRALQALRGALQKSPQLMKELVEALR
jgi:RNA polymerase sigma factor (sigma-70 family)